MDPIDELDAEVHSHDNDPTFYAVPGTTHAFVPWSPPKRRFERFRRPLKEWFGMYCCAVCGIGREWHDKAPSNQLKKPLPHGWEIVK